MARAFWTTFASLSLIAAMLSSTPAAAMPPPTALDIVFLVDGSGSIDANDFAIQKDGITRSLEDPAFFPLDGSISVSLIQWSSSVRVELDRTVLSSPADRDTAIATIGGMSQLGGGTSPDLGINAYSQVLTELGSGNQTLCLSTDGRPASQSALLAAAAAADAAGIERLTVLGIEDPGFFTAADAQTFYGPAVFGDGTVVTTRNAAEFAQVVSGACIGSPVELVGLEVNQNVQTWTNTVRLVANKATIVRAHVQSTDGTPTQAIGRLFGERNGATLPGSPLAPINTSVEAQADAVAVRGDINASLNFVLPDSWVSGSVSLRVELLGGRILCSEAATPANTCEAAVTFETVNTPIVRLVKVPYTDKNGNEQVVSSADLDEQAERLKTVLPIPGLTYERRILNPDDPFVEDADPDKNEGFLGNVNESLLTARSNDGSKALYLGALEGSVPKGGGGLAAGIGSNASSWFVAGTEDRDDYGYARNRGPHEFAHNVGEKHAGADDKVTLCSGNDKNKGVVHPFRDTIGGNEVPLLSPLGDDDTEAWGVDHRFVIDGTNDDLAVIDPNTTFALMGYCNSTDNTSQGRWIDTDYQPRLLDAINNIDWTEGPDPDGGFWSWVRGIFDVESGDTEFKPFISNEPGVVPTMMPSGDYRVELKDEGGNVILTETFEPIIFESDADAPFGDEAQSVGIFVVPIESAPSFASVDFVDPAGTVLGTIDASPNPPTVSVLTPVAGEAVSGESIDVTWTSSDPDGDDLFHTVQYSSDGGTTWTTITIDSTGTSTSIPRSVVAGSDSAVVRVIASDGTRSAADESEFFLVADNAPTVRITNPTDGASFSGVQSVLLRGSAQDNEDGVLSDSISWSSDLDGALGVGAEVALVASDLSEGLHTITASTTDSGANVATETVSITISRVGGPPGVGDVTVELDGVAWPNEPVDVTAEFTGGVAPFTVVVDWGDGSSCPGTGSCLVDEMEDVMPAIVDAEHIYANAGQFMVTVTVTDATGAVFAGSATTVACDIIGTDRADTLRGTEEAEVICGLGGNDRIFGNGGNDTIIGGTGRDNINGGDGSDLILAGRDRDVVSGGDGNDVISGGNANDLLRGGTGDDTINGRLGDDTIFGENGNDELIGGRGADRLYGGNDDDVLRGRRDADRLVGNNGDDDLFGGQGRDNLTGNNGADELFGGTGTDGLNGGRGDDALNGGDGSDQCRSGGGSDTFAECER